MQGRNVFVAVALEALYNHLAVFCHVLSRPTTSVADAIFSEVCLALFYGFVSKEFTFFQWVGLLVYWTLTIWFLQFL